MDTTTGQKRDAPSGQGTLPHLARAILIPTLLFGLGYGLVTGEFAASFAVSLTISVTLAAVYALDWTLLRPRLARLARQRRLALEIAFACLETLLGAGLAFLICVRVYRFNVSPASLGASIGLVFLFFLIFRSVRYAREFYQDLRKQELLEEQLRTLAAEAELKALKAQINPHFLFNTLNTIAALTHSDPERAEQTIERLAELFRHTLNGSEQRQVPLKDELAFADIYLEIEQARFGDRLQVTREIAPEALDRPVPSLILQPLIENAVKHGRAADGTIRLTIRAHLQDDRLVVSIADQGPGMPPHFAIGNGAGHGLRNVDERLRRLYGPAWGVEIAANEPRGAVVTVRIPLAERP